jgi:Zn-dependent peptidase ImmA (M78 family)
MTPDDTAMQGRVRQVVRETGLTHVQFADEIHLNPDKLSKSLNGVRRFTSYELALIAERGRTTVDWLLTGVPPARISVAARASERHERSGLDHALCRAREVAGVHEILQRLDVIDRPLPELPHPFLSGLAIEDGPRLATETLKRLLEVASWDELRDDPAAVIEAAFGINVLVEEFGDGFDGLACATPSFRLIIVNSRIPWSRQRFTLFHECAHILAGDGSDDSDCVVDGDVMGEADRIEEMRANSFAAAALMPDGDVRDHVESPVTAEKFASLVGRYRVSPDALAWRLKTLGLVSKRERAELGAMPVQQAALLGGWPDEYARLTENQNRPRPTAALAQKALHAFVQGTISARPVGTLLHIDPSTLLKMRTAAAESAGAEDDAKAVFAP